MADENVTRENRVFTVNASVGNMPISCFVALRSFFHREQHVNEPVVFTEEHVHSSHELLVCKEGSGFQFISERPYSYSANSVFVMAPFVKHANLSDNNSHELRYSIRFEPTPNTRTTQPNLLAALSRLKEDGCLHLRADETLIFMLSKLEEIVKKDNQHIDILLGGILSAVFSCVFYELCTLPGHEQDLLKSFVDQDDTNRRKFLLDYYFDHMVYDDESGGTMDAMCKQLHLSPSQLNRVIKETYGTTFKQKSIEVRLAYIKYYLLHTSLSISDIAKHACFASDGNFSLFFKQHTGLSPTQYRQLEVPSGKNSIV